MQNEIERIHGEAIDLYEEGRIAELKGETTKATALYKEAYRKEWEAATMIPASPDAEPTRSIVFLSGAAMACKGGDFELANELAVNGLSGAPSRETREELESLLRDKILPRLR